MYIYVLLLLVIMLNLFLEISFTNIKISQLDIKTKNMSFFICFIFILYLGLFRDELLGVDVANYKNYFNGIYANNGLMYFITNLRMYDIGYVLLNKFILLFTKNFRILEITIFLISFGIFSCIIFKKSKYPAFSFLIYISLGFIGINLCILRQAIAYSLCFLSFDYLKRDKKAKFLLFVLLATMFHKTAIFFLFAYPITSNHYKNLSIYKRIIFIAIFILGSIFIMPKLYKYYANDYSNMSIAGEGYKLLLIYFLLHLILRFIPYIGKNNEMNYDCSYGSVYFQIGAISFSVFTRIANYYSLFFTLTIPNIVYQSKNKKIYISIFSMLFGMIYIYKLFENSTNIVPYISIF